MFSGMGMFGAFGFDPEEETKKNEEMKVEVDLAAERDKTNAYQRENEMLIRKIDSSLTVEELLRHLSKGGGNSVVIGIK